jgi:putative tryptophan/tyrosine transport system substrate-binding protein
MKKNFAWLCLLLSLVGCNEPTDMKKVYITQIVEHPALNQTREGVKNALKDAGYIVGENLKLVIESAHNNYSIAAQIAQKFIGDKPDVIVAISTPSAQALLNANIDATIPILFGAVTDPVAAKLNKGNISGVTDKTPINPQLDLIKSIVPEAKNIGVIYNPGEVNSRYQVNEILRVAKKQTAFTIYEANAVRASDIPTAVLSLMDKVDAFYIPTDNVAASAIDAIIKIANDRKIPVFVEDVELVKHGAIGALGTNRELAGKQLGQMVVRLLKGENISNIPIENPHDIALVLNSKAAENLDIVLDPSLIEKADNIL